MAITAALVKKLREMSGAGMMDAKKALVEVDGDIEAAMDWLRTKGLAKAAKKAGRTAAEGLVAVKVAGGVGVAVEVNAETDFVAKNADFQAMVAKIADAALSVDSLEGLLKADLGGKSVEDTVTDAIATIGENMSVRRMSKVTGDVVGHYIHTAAADGMGKIGCLVALNGGDADFAKQVSMHVAAADPRPQSLTEADLDPAVVDKEKRILTDQARESGKPENIIENMIKGRMKKFFAEVTLVNQSFVINPDLTVGAAAKEAGADVAGFVRMEVGEGIEKKEEDFAAEVAKTMGG